MQLSGLQGQLRATIDASGNLTEPEKGQRTVATRVVRRHLERPPVHRHEPGPIRYADERLAVEKLEVEASDSSFTVTGDLPLTDRAGEGAIDVEPARRISRPSRSTCRRKRTSRRMAPSR